METANLLPHSDEAHRPAGLRGFVDGRGDGGAAGGVDCDTDNQVRLLFDQTC